jgi:hypothetical protein
LLSSRLPLRISEATPLLPISFPRALVVDNESEFQCLGY